VAPENHKSFGLRRGVDVTSLRHYVIEARASNSASSKGKET
jgi:hypothetical protein